MADTITINKDRIFIMPYRKGSESVKGLGRNIPGMRAIKYEGSKYSSKDGDLVINWGNSNPSVDISKATVLNFPEKISRVSNKLSFFRHISSLEQESRPNIPEWTQSKEEAGQWLSNGKVVFARTKLTGHSGEGIVEIEKQEDLNSVPDQTLLVKYIPKKTEWRAHFWCGDVFDWQQKQRAHRVEDENVNWRVRSHQNGFIYSRNELNVPEKVKEQAELCMKASELQFGAIDIIYNEWYNKATCLEINTAPGLTETTLWNYVDKINSWIGVNS